MTNTNIITIDEITRKIVADYSDVEKLADMLTIHNFKKSVTLNEANYQKKDTLIAYTGNTHNEDLISVWSRVEHKRSKADYGVRVSDKLLKRLSEIESVKLLLSSAKYADSNESRISFSSVSDVEMFFNQLFSYVEARKQTKSADTVTTEESVSA